MVLVGKQIQKDYDMASGCGCGWFALNHPLHLFLCPQTIDYDTHTHTTSIDLTGLQGQEQIRK